MKLVAKNLIKKYDDKLVLDEVGYKFREGATTSVSGKNGAGKTTLFNVLYDEIDFDSGESYLENNGEIGKLRKEDIGTLFFESFSPEFLTGYECIRFYRGINSLNDIGAVENHMKVMEFSKRDQNRLVRDCSHGVKSKVFLITSSVSRPEILLSNEPLASLDVVTSTQTKKLLVGLESQGRVVVLSAHMLNLTEQLSEEIILLHRKKLQKLDLGKNDKEFGVELYGVLEDEPDE